MKQHHFNRSNLAKIMNWDHYQELERAYLDYTRRENPTLPEFAYVALKNVVTGTRPSNTIENCITFYGKWSGKYHAEKINTTGRYIPNVGYIPTRGQKGSADVSCTFPGGKVVKVEVKYGKDKQSDDQKEYQRQIEAMGGEYWIVRTFGEFMERI